MRAPPCISEGLLIVIQLITSRRNEVTAICNLLPTLLAPLVDAAKNDRGTGLLKRRVIKLKPGTEGVRDCKLASTPGANARPTGNIGVAENFAPLAVSVHGHQRSSAVTCKEIRQNRVSPVSAYFSKVRKRKNCRKLQLVNCHRTL